MPKIFIQRPDGEHEILQSAWVSREMQKLGRGTENTCSDPIFAAIILHASWMNEYCHMEIYWRTDRVNKKVRRLEIKTLRPTMCPAASLAWVTDAVAGALRLILKSACTATLRDSVFNITLSCKIHWTVLTAGALRWRLRSRTKVPKSWTKRGYWPLWT